jgi:hypothetical protein
MEVWTERKGDLRIKHRQQRWGRRWHGGTHSYKEESTGETGPELGKLTDVGEGSMSRL